MGLKDMFKKKKDSSENEDKMGLGDALDQVDTKGLSMKEKMGLKMFKKMSPEKQEDLLRKAMNPAEVMKNKDKILAQIDEMVKSGQIDKSQAEAVKSRMGLR